MPQGSKSPSPPLLALGCLVAGWGLGLLRPLGVAVPGVLRQGLAAALMSLSAGLVAWGLLTFRRAGTSPDPNGVAKALLTSGPYRFSRNPLYLALSTFLAGFGLVIGSGWMLAMAPVLGFLLDRLVIVREEARLRAQFGDVYGAYARRVRRWL